MTLVTLYDNRRLLNYRETLLHVRGYELERWLHNEIARIFPALQDDILLRCFNVHNARVSILRIYHSLQTPFSSASQDSWSATGKMYHVLHVASYIMARPVRGVLPAVAEVW